MELRTAMVRQHDLPRLRQGREPATSRRSATSSGATTARHAGARSAPTSTRSSRPSVARAPRSLEALALLSERNSLRAVARLTHHSPNRVLHWLALAGQHGAAVSAALIRDLPLTQVQIDELWTFVKKSKPTASPEDPADVGDIGSGAPWPCPAGCAWSATSAMIVASRKRGRSWPNSRPEPMDGRPSSPATNCRRMSPR